MTTLNDLVTAVETQGIPDKETVLGKISGYMKCFQEYYNRVIMGTLNGDYTDNNDPIIRCMIAGRELNKICDELGIEHICDFDVSDKRAIDEYCGELIMGLYVRGIGDK